MGNGCCGGDRHDQQTATNDVRLQELIAACKDVESVLPRLEKETNRTRQTLYYLTAETEAVDVELQETTEERKKLKEELGKNADSVDMSRLRNNRTLQRTLSGRIVDPTEVMLNHVLTLHQRVGLMIQRLNKAHSQLEINVQNSLQVLLTDLENLLKSQEALLRSGLESEKEFSSMTSITRPGALLHRLIVLRKELEDMKNQLRLTDDKAYAKEKDLENTERELAEIKSGLEEYIYTRSPIKHRSIEPIHPPSKPPTRPPPTIQPTSNIEIPSFPSPPPTSPPDFYLQQVDSMRNSLKSEQEKRNLAERNSLELKNALEMQNFENLKAKARVIVNVWRLISSRILLKSIAKWKISIKHENFENKLKILEIREEKLANRRKFKRLMQILSKFYVFSEEKYMQKWKETQIRLSYHSPRGSKSALTPKETETKSIFMVLQRINRRKMREVLRNIGKLYRYSEGVRGLVPALWSVYSHRLVSGLIALRFYSEERSEESEGRERGLGSVEPSEESVEDEGMRRSVVPVGEFKRSTTVQFARTTL